MLGSDVGSRVGTNVGIKENVVGTAVGLTNKRRRRPLEFGTASDCNSD